MKGTLWNVPVQESPIRGKRADPADPGTDPGTGVMRHADAGYERALEVDPNLEEVRLALAEKGCADLTRLQREALGSA
mgnify:CR=1 FL=1